MKHIFRRTKKVQRNVANSRSKNQDRSRNGNQQLHPCCGLREWIYKRYREAIQGRADANKVNNNNIDN